MDWLPQSVHAKLERAEEHLRQLDAAVQGSLEGQLVTCWTDRDRQGRVRIRVKELGEIPDQWHVWIGECVHDMRSALDHLAFGLNIVGSGMNPPPNADRSQFPIYSSRADFRKDLVIRGKKSGRTRRGYIEHFPRGARTQVQRLQPYARRERTPWSNRRLSDLAELSNIDKHRQFPITAYSSERLETPTLIESQYFVRSVRTRYCLLKPNTTVAWLEVPTMPRGYEPNVHFKLRPDIEFAGASANPPVRLLVPHEPVTFSRIDPARHLRARSPGL